MPESKQANTKTERIVAAAVAAAVTRRRKSKEKAMPKTKKIAKSVEGKSRTHGAMKVPEAAEAELSPDRTPAMPVAEPDAWSEAVLEQARKGGDVIAEFLGADNTFAKMAADELLDAAEGIDKKTRTAERLKTREDILKAAAAAKLTPVKETALLRILAQRTDATAKAVEEEFAAIVAEFEKIDAPTAEELAAQRAEEEARLAAERAAEAAALEGEVMPLASDPKLMEKLMAFAQENGVVGEEAGIVAVMLTLMSRLNRRRAMSLLRRGAPASGKNHVIETLLAMLEPNKDYITFSDGSPKSLAYFGGVDNADVFKNMALYLPEAATIASKHGREDDDKATYIRILLSENKFEYTTVQTQDNGPPMAVTITKTGPIAVLTTSARNNVEEELLTRILVSDADEGAAQTSLIVNSTVKRAARGGSKNISGTTLDIWAKLQRWLRLGGPYDVHVPPELADAIAAGYVEVQQTGGIPLRVRRDVVSLLSAVSASAILHKAQRQRAEDGAIIANIADYAVAVGAFSDSLRSLYKPGTGIASVRLVEVIEKLIADEAAKAAEERKKAMKDEGLTEAQYKAKHPFSEETDGVKASYEQLGRALGLTTTSTVGQRIKAAASEGVIEAIDSGRGGRSAARTYRVLVPSTDLKSPARRVPVVPTPQRVAELVAKPAEAKSIIKAANAAAKAAQAQGVKHDDEEEEAGA